LYSKGCVDLSVHLETYLYIRWLLKKLIKPFTSTPQVYFVRDTENIRLLQIKIPKVIQESPNRMSLIREFVANEEIIIKEELVKGLIYFFNLAKVIWKEDEIPQILAYGNIKESRRVRNLKDVVKFFPTKLGPNSADVEIQKAILLWD
jgi:hypothetical protein